MCSTNPSKYSFDSGGQQELSTPKISSKPLLWWGAGKRSLKSLWSLFPPARLINDESRGVSSTFHLQLYSTGEERQKDWGPFQELLYGKVIIFSFCLCQERGGGGEALKCLIWETVNRIYANLMIPAITGGSTSHSQAAEILLQLLLQLPWVGFQPVLLFQWPQILTGQHWLTPVTPRMRSQNESRIFADADGIPGEPIPRFFGARWKETCPGASLCKGKALPASLILWWSFANTDCSAQLP